MKFYIRTLGCKMNWLDGAHAHAALVQAGHSAAANEADADLVLVNTCTVTGEAERKSRQEARRFVGGDQQVAVMGCAPRVDHAGWSERLPNANIFTSTDALFEHLQIDPADSWSAPNSRTRLPIAIQTGCDNHCTFCITKVARGPHASIKLTAIVDQVKRAVDEGILEVVLTGINLAAWGSDNSNHADSARLHTLIEALLAQTEIARIRISSIGPQYLQPAFFALFADDRLCDHLHLSVQSGSRSVLARMQRGHGCNEIAHIAERARQVRPDVALTADMIVGFPGESDAEFAETMAFSEQVGFAKLHVFPYSTREGTLAATAPNQIPEQIKKQRSTQLRTLGRDLRQQFIHAQMGRALMAVGEQDGNGWSSNYIKVRTGAAQHGTLVPLVLNADTLAERGCA